MAITVDVDKRYEYTLTRILNAPPEFVFRMWSEPEHINQWCRPKDFTIPTATMDFRPGGQWTSHIRSADGLDYYMKGNYVEIVPNEKIVFTHVWVDEAGDSSPTTEITLIFKDDEKGTKLTFRQVGFLTQSASDSHAEGWGEAIDNLVAYISGI